MNIEHQTPNLLTKMLEIDIDLEQKWGSPRLAYVLCAATMEETWLPMPVLERLTQMSHETVRRLLKPLLEVGRVEVEKSGKKFVYRASELWAARTMDATIAVCAAAYAAGKLVN